MCNKKQHMKTSAKCGVSSNIIDVKPTKGETNCLICYSNPPPHMWNYKLIFCPMICHNLSRCKNWKILNICVTHTLGEQYSHAQPALNIFIGFLEISSWPLKLRNSKWKEVAPIANIEKALGNSALKTATIYLKINQFCF